MQVITILLALQALESTAAARPLPLIQPEHAVREISIAVGGQKQSAELESTGQVGNLPAQPRTIRRYRKLLQGVLISDMAAVADGTKTADGKDLCKTDDCKWKQYWDSIKLAGECLKKQSK